MERSETGEDGASYYRFWVTFSSVQGEEELIMMLFLPITSPPRPRVNKADVIIVSIVYLLYYLLGLFAESQVRRIGRLAARYDRQRLGLAQWCQGSLQQSVIQGEGRLVRREWLLFRDGRQSPRQVLVPGVFTFCQGESRFVFSSTVASNCMPRVTVFLLPSSRLTFRFIYLSHTLLLWCRLMRAQ